MIERAGRPPDEKPDKKMTDSWEELGLVSASPKLLHKGIEGVVMKQIAAATKKGTCIFKESSKWRYFPSSLKATTRNQNLPYLLSHCAQFISAC